MAPTASTSKLPSSSSSRRSSTQAREPSLVSNTKSLPVQQEVRSLLHPPALLLTALPLQWLPPLAQLSKYLYTSPRLTSQHSTPSKSLPSKKLAHHLHAVTSSAKASSLKSHEHDDLLLDHTNAGMMQVESEMERTWRITQDEIREGAAVGVHGKAFGLRLDEFGPYEVDYTPNGRHLAIGGRLGHVATFDWQSGALHSELHLKETVRCIKWLHDESFFAVAQKKYVYIYDKSGLEVHQLRNHIEVNRMEFLRYHFLLATIGNAGYLKYQDTSTGSLVAEHRTKLGSCSTMAQNPYNAFIHLGHQNGSVTLWSPSVPRAQVQLLAHSGPVTSIALDPSTMGNRMATTGLDGSVKIWDTRKWGVLNEYRMKKIPKSVAWSQKGMLGVGWGNHVSVFNDLLSPSHSARAPPPPYLTSSFPSTPISSILFCPFEDILGVGHSSGFSSLLVPGAGEANFDSLEADPFEGKRRRREREVNALLDKVPADLITLDIGLLGKLDEKVKAGEGEGGVVGVLGGGKEVPFVRKTRIERLRVGGKSTEEMDEEDSEEEEGDVDEERRKKKKVEREEKADAKKRARGRNSTLKKMLRKRKRNVVDPITVAIKEKIVQQRKATIVAKQNARARKSAESGTAGALDRFSFGK